MPGVVAIAAILLGIVGLSPWTSNLVDISKAEGLLALQNEEYVHNWQMVAIFGPIQAIALIVVAFISVIKPLGILRKPE